MDKNNGYYTLYDDNDNTPDSIMEYLSDNMPHGSGLNGNWYIDTTRTRVYAYNTYSAMNDGGYYCHDYPVVVTFARGHKCTNENCVSGKLNPAIGKDDKGRWIYAVCPVCHGKGFIPDKNYLYLLDARIKGRELKCCGYGLNEYISDTFYSFDYEPMVVENA